MAEDPKDSQPIPEPEVSLVRMPPKMVRRHIEDVERGVVMPRPGEPGSLPVLEAFQEYLETERRQARGRLWALTFFYTAILLTLLAGGYFLTQSRLHDVDGDVSALGNELQALETSTAQTLNLISNMNARLSTQDVMFREAVHHDRGRLKDVQDRIGSMQGEYEAQIETMISQLEALKGKNAELGAAVGTFGTRLDHATNQIVAARATTAREGRSSVGRSGRRASSARTSRPSPKPISTTTFDRPAPSTSGAVTTRRPSSGLPYRLGSMFEDDLVASPSAAAPAGVPAPVVPESTPIVAPVRSVAPVVSAGDRAPVLDMADPASPDPLRGVGLPSVGRKIEPLPELKPGELDRLVGVPDGVTLPEVRAKDVEVTVPELDATDIDRAKPDLSIDDESSVDESDEDEAAPKKKRFRFRLFNRE